MGKTSDVIFSLQPVNFRYKHDLDPDGVPQFGLVAEEVEKVNPELVVHDEHGKPYTVRYDAVNAMLLNEFLKEHRKVEQQGSEIAQLKYDLNEQRGTFQANTARQDKAITALAARIKQVSAYSTTTHSTAQITTEQ